jgi:cyclophilin family peptidyl-prolyl cis-trans isomerase
VANFIKLANEGYYNGTKFHRIVDHFMIQGGDPNSKNDDPSDDGQGGPGYTIPAEIGLKHNVGAISMARLSDQVNPNKESSGSQFFIVLEESPENHQALDGQYTAFGYVTKGMDVVAKIGKTPVEPNPFTGETSLPLKPVTINKITITEVK